MRKRLLQSATLVRTAGASRAGARSMLTFDVSLAWATLLLLAIGLVMVYSASIAMAEASAHTGFRPWYFLARHAVFLVVGLLAAAVTFQIPIKTWQRLSIFLFAIAALLLVLVLVPGVGKVVNGSRRWLPLGLINMQPSEFMKLAAVLYASSYAVRKADFLHAEQPLRQTLVRGFLPLFAVMTAVGGLLILEPDFGAFVVIVAIGFGILFLGGLDWRLFAGLSLLLPVALGAVLVAAPYRIQRLTAFLDPWADPLHKGYQLSHSLIAFGRGEWLGVGLGSSVEKLLYLPEAHTDFLLAVIAEELGFMGVTVGDPAVRLGALSRVRVGPPGGAAVAAVRGAGRVGHRHLARRADVHQHGRQHGRAAHEGPDAAAAVVRRQRHRRELHRDRDPAADRLGEPAAAAGVHRMSAARCRGPTVSATVMITTGGTGGHVFPGLAVAAKLVARGARVFWLGTREGMEAKLVAAHGVEFESVSFRGVRGKGARTMLLGPFALVAACIDSLRVIRRRRPDVVIGFGGFASFPGALMGVATRKARWCCTRRTRCRASPIACSRTAPIACCSDFPTRCTDAPRAAPSGWAIRCAMRSRRCRRRASASPGAADRCVCSSSAEASAPRVSTNASRVRSRRCRRSRGRASCTRPASGTSPRCARLTAARASRPSASRSSTTWRRSTRLPISCCAAAVR